MYNPQFTSNPYQRSMVQVFLKGEGLPPLHPRKDGLGNDPSVKLHSQEITGLSQAIWDRRYER